jgi:hypothetical protein
VMSKNVHGHGAATGWARFQKKHSSHGVSTWQEIQFLFAYQDW